MKTGLLVSFLFVLSFPSWSLAAVDDDIAAAPSEPSARLEYFILKAQDAYFSGADQNSSKAFYEQAASLKNSAHWDQDQIKAIHFSMLRLSQLSLSTAERDQWLRSAIDFDPSLAPDTELFPPPLVKRFNSLKAQHSAENTVKNLALAEKSASTNSAPADFALQKSAASQVQSSPSYFEELQAPLNEPTPLWKNKWVWMGAGVLVAGYLIYDHNKEKRQESPAAVTYGF